MPQKEGILCTGEERISIYTRNWKGESLCRHQRKVTKNANELISWLHLHLFFTNHNSGVMSPKMQAKSLGWDRLNSEGSTKLLPRWLNNTDRSSTCPSETRLTRKWIGSYLFKSPSCESFQFTFLFCRTFRSIQPLKVPKLRIVPRALSNRHDYVVFRVRLFGVCFLSRKYIRYYLFTGVSLGSFRLMVVGKFAETEFARQRQFY